MPRKSKKARSKPHKKKIFTKHKVKLIWVQDDGISPGRIRAAAEYIKN